MKLQTTYLGLQLPHPFIAGSSPMADSVDTARRFEDVGAAAIVMRSLFQEQLDEEAMATYEATAMHTDSTGEATSFLPDHDDFMLGPDDYLSHLSALKAALDIPVFASLNGASLGGWLQYAQLIEQAGADALELNLYDVITDPNAAGHDVENDTIEMVRTVKSGIRIPVAVKLSPFYTSLPNFARCLVEAGADGLILFNRFFGPDVDLDELELHPHLELSSSSELPLRLRWLAILSERVNTSLAISGGVHTSQDAIKAVMCGAHAVQMVSALLKQGPQHISKLCDKIRAWLEDEEYASLEQMQGSMGWQRCPNPQALTRVNYVKLLKTWQAEG